MRIAVLGTGSWGTVLANLLAEEGHQVKIWGNVEHIIDEINDQHTNKHYLTDFTITKKLKAEKDLAPTLADVEIVLFVVPTNAIRIVAEEIKPYLEKMSSKPILVHAAKGIELKTELRISQVIESVLPPEEFGEVVAISGPSHAEDVAKKDITMLTAASRDMNLANIIQRSFRNNYFQLYTSPDIIGVEIGAALKNVIAIGAGIAHGLGYGDNTKAALMTRGLAEMTRFGVKLGADPLTFSGLSGVGDLIVTCTSVNSRNWRAGNQLGQGANLKDVLDNMGMVVEGVSTAKVVHQQAKELNIKMPLTNYIYQVLYENLSIEEAISSLMQRDMKPEIQLD